MRKKRSRYERLAELYRQAQESLNQVEPGSDSEYGMDTPWQMVMSNICNAAIEDQIRGL